MVAHLLPGLVLDDRIEVADMVAYLPRSAQQVTKRLDRLIAQIREIQAPYMNGEKPADVVLVRPVSCGL